MSFAHYIITSHMTIEDLQTRPVDNKLNVEAYRVHKDDELAKRREKKTGQVAEVQIESFSFVIIRTIHEPDYSLYVYDVEKSVYADIRLEDGDEPYLSLTMAI